MNPAHQTSTWIVNIVSIMGHANAMRFSINRAWLLRLVERSRFAAPSRKSIEVSRRLVHSVRSYKKNNSSDAHITSQAWYQDFVRFVELKDLLPRTRQTYLNWLRQLARHCDPRSVQDLSESEVLDFLISLRTERELKDSTVNQAVCALRTFYRDHLEHQWQGWNKIKIRREEQLPNVLSREEVFRLLSVVHENRFRAILLLVNCFLRPGFLEAEGPGKVGVQVS